MISPTPGGLLPCPFCGSDKVKATIVPNTQGNRRYMYCLGCFAEGPWSRLDANEIELWNRREALSETVPTVAQLLPDCADLARRDIALTEAAHDLLVACRMEDHNEAIFKGKWKKGSKAWSGEFVHDRRQDAMARISALTEPNAAPQVSVTGDSAANAEADGSRGTTALSSSATSEDKFAMPAVAARDEQFDKQHQCCMGGPLHVDPCASCPNHPIQEFRAWLDTYGHKAGYDRGDLAACWYAGKRSAVSAKLFIEDEKKK